MPQISMGRAGAWTRWNRKPSVSTTFNQPALTLEQTLDLASEQKQKILSEVEEEGRAMLEAARLRAVEIAKSIASEHVGTDKECVWNAALSTLNAAYEVENADKMVSSGGEVVDHDKNSTNLDCATPLEPVSATCFDVDILDEQAFPRLVSPQQKVEVQKVPQVMNSVLTESSSGVTKNDESQDVLPLEQVEAKDELLEDWIVLPSGDSNDASLTTREKSFDGRHPRHVFAKQDTTKRANSKTEAWELDWSQAGIPREIKRQLIHGSSDASHRGIHANKQSAPLPLSALRSQSIGSSRRQNSTPRTPRAQSKPRMIHQPTKRR
jgi:hypothetical protein